MVIRKDSIKKRIRMALAQDLAPSERELVILRVTAESPQTALLPGSDPLRRKHWYLAATSQRLILGGMSALTDRQKASPVLAYLLDEFVVAEYRPGVSWNSIALRPRRGDQLWWLGASWRWRKEIRLLRDALGADQHTAIAWDPRQGPPSNG